MTDCPQSFTFVLDVSLIGQILVYRTISQTRGQKTVHLLHIFVSIVLQSHKLLISLEIWARNNIFFNGLELQALEFCAFNDSDQTSSNFVARLINKNGE